MKTSPYSHIWNNKKLLEEALIGAESIMDVLKRLGVKPYAGSYKTIKKVYEKHELKLPVFNSSLCTKQAIIRKTLLPEEVFVDTREHTGATLKKHMILVGIEYVCKECGQLPFWNNKVLTLQVDHIDGNRLNNFLKNLRFLCPNCHTQTDTHSGKNKNKKIK